MPSIKNKFVRVSTALTAAVADNGTFTVAYPSGYSQSDFNVGLAGSGHYMIVDNNDRWSNADPGISVSFGASNITITNLTGQTLASGSEIELFFDLADGNNVMTLAFQVDLASITGTQDVVTDFRPGVDGTIENLSFVTNAKVTTAAKAASLNAEIGTTDLTGGVIALTSAALANMGAVVEGSAITGANALTRDDKISIKASSVTAFAEGSGTLLMRIRLTDSDRQ